MCSVRQRHTKGILQNGKLCNVYCGAATSFGRGSGSENGAICLFFKQNTRFQAFCSPKPVSHQQKPEAPLHFSNYRVALSLFRTGIGLGVPVACLFFSLRSRVDNGALVPVQSGRSQSPGNPRCSCRAASHPPACPGYFCKGAELFKRGLRDVGLPKVMAR